jgi:hypothetical protein
MPFLVGPTGDFRQVYLAFLEQEAEIQESFLYG